MAEEAEDRDITLVKRAAANLIEHFDSVMIFANRHNSSSDGGTISVQHGLGNFYARYGHVRQWLLEEEQKLVSDDAAAGDDD